MLINVLALVWGGSMLINFLWPRDITVGGQNPPLSALPNITVPGFLSNIPVYEFTLGVIILVGLVYWAVAQRKAPETPIVQPAEAPA